MYWQGSAFKIGGQFTYAYGTLIFGETVGRIALYNVPQNIVKAVPWK